jgi:uncharacterized RDD family membrane protein YckC
MSDQAPPPGPPQPPDPYAPANPYGEPHPYEGGTSPYGEPHPYGVQPGQPGQAGPPPPQNPYQPTGGQGAPSYQPPEPYPFGPYTYQAVPVAFATSGYASWISRVGAYFIDAICGALAAFPAYVGYFMLVSQLYTTTSADGTTTEVHLKGSAAIPVTFMLIGGLTGLAFFIWNVCLRQGRTGATIGKSVLAIRTVSLSEGRPIGPVMAFVRYLCRFFDGLLCGLGYLWPLWDSKNQTFADKIVRTVVINAVEPAQR